MHAENRRIDPRTDLWLHPYWQQSVINQQQQQASNFNRLIYKAMRHEEVKRERARSVRRERGPLRSLFLRVHLRRG